MSSSRLTRFSYSRCRLLSFRGSTTTSARREFTCRFQCFNSILSSSMVILLTEFKIKVTTCKINLFLELWQINVLGKPIFPRDNRITRLKYPKKRAEKRQNFQIREFLKMSKTLLPWKTSMSKKKRPKVQKTKS